MVKNLPAMQEIPVQFLGWEDPLEKGTPVFWPREFYGLYRWICAKASVVKCSVWNLVVDIWMLIVKFFQHFCMFENFPNEMKGEVNVN